MKKARLTRPFPSPMVRVAGSVGQILYSPETPGSAMLRGVSDVTRILQSIEEGDPKAAEELLPLVYDELRRLAAHKMSNEAGTCVERPLEFGAWDLF